MDYMYIAESVLALGMGSGTETRAFGLSFIYTYWDGKEGIRYGYGYDLNTF